jgi:hypothetical protein
VRILPSNIPVQTSRNSSVAGSTAVENTLDRRRASAADASAQKNPQPSPGIIDAEYVEFYTPSARSYNHERNTLDSTLETPEAAATANEPAARRLSPTTGSYQRLAAPDPPLPGTFIDIFA